MILTHALITRFSYEPEATRCGASVTVPNRSTIRPLEEWRLNRRFLLFEATCLPSVMAQTNQDFVWLVLIDRRLPAHYRARLGHAVRAHPRTHLVEYEPGMQLDRLAWVRRFAYPSGSTHIATTNIDDDDVLGPRVVEHTQAALYEARAGGQLLPCSVVGCVSPVQWDFIPGRTAPFGYLKPWVRPRYLSYAGYTVCCLQPHFDFSVLAFEHSRTREYFDPSRPPIDSTHHRLRCCADEAGEDWRKWSAKGGVYSLCHSSAQVIVVNHLDNDQIGRLYEGWAHRRPVGLEELREMGVAVDKVPMTIRYFARSISALLRHLERRWWLLTRPGLCLRVRWQRFAEFVVSPVWFFVGTPVIGCHNGGRFLPTARYLLAGAVYRVFYCFAPPHR